MTNPFDEPGGEELLRDALSDQRILNGSDELLDATAKAVTVHKHQAGDSIVTEGAAGNEVFFLLAGPDVEVTVKGVPVSSRPKGDVIGEMAVLEPAGVRSATVKATGETYVAVLSGEDFRRLANQFPGVVYRQLARLLAEKLRQRGRFIRARSAKPRLFIGSASENLDVIEAIQANLAHAHIEVCPWTQGVFKPSSTTIEDLDNALERFDFALFVMNGIDEVTSRGSSECATRDNVLLEFGMFVGKLGRGRVFGLHERGAAPRRASDLAGVLMLDYPPGGDLRAALGAACVQLKEAIADRGPR